MARKSRADLLIQANVIKNETVANKNTQVRVGTMNIDEIDSAININDTEPNTWYVNTNGDDDVGSDKFPFEGIQAAHDAATDGDLIIIQDINFQQPLTPTIVITKSLTIKGVTSNTDKQPRLRGTWNLSTSIFFENVSLIEVTIVGAATIGVDTINCFISDLITPVTRNLIIEQWNCIMFNSSAINVRSLESHNSVIASDINAGRTIAFHNVSYEDNLIAGIDAALTSIMINSFIDGNITITGGLEINNSVITGTEAVSGTTTSRQAKVFDDSVEFKDKVSIGVSAFLNKLDVAGGMAVGSGIAGILTAPLDGLRVETDIEIGDEHYIGRNSSNAVFFDDGNFISFLSTNFVADIFPTSGSDFRFGADPSGQPNGIVFKALGLSGWREMMRMNNRNAGIPDIVFVVSEGNAGFGNSDPATKVDISGAITQRELSTDPSDPAEGSFVTWMSDGTGSGDDGDIMMKITAGAVTKTTTLVDFSAI